MIIVGVEQEPRMQFTIECDPESPPQLIELKDGTKLVFVGKYASPGNEFSYRRVTNTLNYRGEVKDWVRYTKLTG